MSVNTEPTMTDDQAPQADTSPAEPETVWVPSPQNVAAHAAPIEAEVTAALSEPVEQPPGALVPDAPRTEAERMDPMPIGPFTLETGTEIEIVPMRLRQTMGLLRIVTRGAGGYLSTLVGELDFEDPAAFAQTLGMIVIMAIPEAEDDAVNFLRSMCAPVGIDHLDKKTQLVKVEELRLELDNPDLNDTVSIIERVIARESEDIRSLGKRIGQAFNLAKRTGQFKKAELKPNEPGLTPKV